MEINGIFCYPENNRWPWNEHNTTFTQQALFMSQARGVQLRKGLSAIPTKNLWYPLILMRRSGHLGQHFPKCLNDLETKLWYNKAGEMLGEFLPWIRNWRLPRSFHKVQQPHKLLRILCVISSTSSLPCKKPQGFFSSLSSWPEWLELPLEKDSLQTWCRHWHRGAKPLRSWNPPATFENVTSVAKSLQNRFKTHP